MVSRPSVEIAMIQDNNKEYKEINYILVYVHVGCFKDDRVNGVTYRAIHGSVVKYSSSVILNCFNLAKALKYEFFGVQVGEECYTYPTARSTYNQYGAGNGCRDGTGGPYQSDVYQITGNKELMQKLYFVA